MKSKYRKSDSVITSCGVLPCLFLLIALCSFAIFYVTHFGNDATRGSNKINTITKEPRIAGKVPQQLSSLTVKYQDNLPSKSVSMRTTTDPAISVVEQVHAILENHPLHSLSNETKAKMSLEDYFVFMHAQPGCQHVPIFTSMANVFSDLYWQL